MTDGAGPTRGGSAFEIEVEEVEDEDRDVEYLEADDAVRYVAGWRHANHEAFVRGESLERKPFYETTPFERWGETRCIRTAATAAADHANDLLCTDEVSSAITALVPGEDRAAIVSISTTLDRTGVLVHEPSVEFDALVAATPASVDVSYRLADRKYQMAVPVYASHDVCREE